MSTELSPEAQFAALLAQLKTDFLRELGPTLDRLCAQAQGVSPQSALAVLPELQKQLHALAGTGGTFGFESLTQQARALEHQAKVWLQGAQAPEAEAWAQWMADLTRLASCQEHPG